MDDSGFLFLYIVKITLELARKHHGKHSRLIPAYIEDKPSNIKAFQAHEKLPASCEIERYRQNYHIHSMLTAINPGFTLSPIL